MRNDGDKNVLQCERMKLRTNRCGFIAGNSLFGDARYNIEYYSSLLLLENYKSTMTTEK